MMSGPPPRRVRGAATRPPTEERPLSERSTSASSLDPAAPPAPAASPRLPAWRRLLESYPLAGVLVFLITVVTRWTAHVDPHEMIYLLGSRRIADPTLLAADFTWSSLPPTSALFDHLIAPLWGFLDEFTIINLGRFVYWVLLAASLAILGRQLRLPAWSIAAGYLLWLAWRQTLATCGLLIEGFQVKSFSYPLMFFSIAAAMSGRVAVAGMCAGLGTAFHIIVGGWGMLALGLAMLLDPRRFPVRRLAVYALSAAPFVLPLLIAVARYHGGHAGDRETALMDEIYVRFAMPHCCDVFYMMTPNRWVRAGIIFSLAPLLAFAWHERREARLLGGFITALVLFFVAGVAAQALRLWSVLKLYPCQLGNTLPALFLFVLVLAWLARGGFRRFGRVGFTLALAGTVWLVEEREVRHELAGTPDWFRFQVLENPWPRPQSHEPLYAWIRENTPRDAVFVTPFLEDFWPYAERAQVASIRHPPLDQRLIEWKERLEAINGFHPFFTRGFGIDIELEMTERRLSEEHLVRIRERYGATHYLVRGERHDLAEHRIHSAIGFSIYDLAGMSVPAAGAAAAALKERRLPDR